MKSIRDFVIEKLEQKLEMFDVKASELNNSFDLVQSGLLDSMGFVNLIGALEQEFEVEIDFESAFDEPDFTTIDGIERVFNQAR